MLFRPIASGSSGNCYYIEAGGCRLLLDAGIPFSHIQEALGFTVATLDGCFITHEHGDHVKAACDLMKMGINVYMTEGTAEASVGHHHRLRTLARYASSEVNYHPLRIRDLEILPIRVMHDAAEPVCYVLRDLTAGLSLAYITDTFYSVASFVGLTHLAIEANYSKEILRRRQLDGELDGQRARRLYRTHMAIETVESMLQEMDKSRLREVWLLHLSDGNSDEQDFKTRIQRITGTPVYVA